ncbi:E3 ubiquitin-protein ligase BRE1-like [Phaseolus vulgaris]
MWNRPIQYGSPYQNMAFSNYAMMAARLLQILWNVHILLWGEVGQSSLLASANTIQRTPAENYMLLNNHSYKSSQPTSNLTPQARENERRYSIQGTNLKGSVRSVTSESKETTVVVNDNKNDGGSTKVHIHLCNESNYTKELRKRKAEQTSSKISSMKNIKLQDIPSRQQQSRMMPGTGKFEANPTDLNQNLHIDPNKSAANPLLEKEESDETKEQRKRMEMNKSSKRPKVKIIKLKDISSIKQTQFSMTAGNGGGANNVTSIENCNSIQDKTNIASDHFEANPTEGNRILSTNLSATNPQLAKEESDEAKEQRRRQSKKKSAKRSRLKMKVERERLNASIRNLDVENAGLRKELRDLIDEYDKLTGNNDSLMDELNEMFGQETVMDVFNMQSADSDADDNQNSNAT